MWRPYFVRFDFSERGSVGAMTSVWIDTANRLVFVEWVPNWELIRLECEFSLCKVFEVSDMGPKFSLLVILSPFGVM